MAAILSAMGTGIEEMQSRLFAHIRDENYGNKR